jgi:HAMP domain-containing protein
MVLDYERGESLKTWWKRIDDIPEAQLLVLLKPLLNGLAVVHQAGYLHRDIKPDNIYVRHEDGSLVLLDFGAARQALGGQQDAAAVITPGYAPVEQYGGGNQGNQGPWTDIYAFGATLYWMVAGKKPAVSLERMDEVLPMLSAEEVGRGRYSVEFLRAIDWALQIDAKDRPQEVESFMRALFGAHPAELGLQEALRAGEANSVVAENWHALLKSPRQARNHLRRIGKALARPSSWRLDVKLMLAMVCAALLPMFITACYNLYGTLASVSDNELQKLEQLAQSAAGRIGQLADDSRNLAYYLGTDEDFVELLRHPTAAAKEAIRVKLENLAKSNRDVDPLIIMDREGTAIVSNDPMVVGRNFKFREYFKEAIAGRSHMTGIIVGAARGAAGVYYSNPVRDPQGAVIGAVVLRLQASSIAAVLEELKQGALTPFMVDGDGVVIYHPDERKLYHSLEPLPAETLERITAEQRFRRDRIDSLDMLDLARAMRGASESGHVSYNSSISNQQEVAGFAPVRGYTWTIGVTELRESFEQPLNRLFTNVLYSLALVGIVFFVLAVLLARTIVRPIERLTQAANALKNGDYAQANISVTTDDEIGRLARTFNIMIDVLRQREREGRRKQPARHDDPLGLDDLGR